MSQPQGAGDSSIPLQPIRSRLSYQASGFDPSIKQEADFSEEVPVAINGAQVSADKEEDSGRPPVVKPEEKKSVWHNYREVLKQVCEKSSKAQFSAMSSLILFANRVSVCRL